MLLQPSIISKRVQDIVPYENNARTHSEAQIASLVVSLREFGFVNPVIIDGNNVIIAGHGRFEAAKRAGYQEVPCILVSHLSERQVNALRLADNKIASLGGWDFEKLSTELSVLAEQDYDLSITGYDEQELDAFLKAETSILPNYSSDFLPTEQKDRSLPRESEGELVPVRPRTSDDEHSTFELVMKHTNKLRLVEVLSRIRQEHEFTKLEDALMWLVDEREKINEEHEQREL